MATDGGGTGACLCPGRCVGNGIASVNLFDRRGKCILPRGVNGWRIRRACVTASMGCDIEWWMLLTYDPTSFNERGE